MVGLHHYAMVVKSAPLVQRPVICTLGAAVRGQPIETDLTCERALFDMATMTSTMTEAVRREPDHHGCKLRMWV